MKKVAKLTLGLTASLLLGAGLFLGTSNADAARLAAGGCSETGVCHLDGVNYGYAPVSASKYELSKN